MTAEVEDPGNLPEAFIRRLRYVLIQSPSPGWP